MSRSELRTDIAIGLALLLANIALNLPLFMPGESPYRDSIELGYAGMSRFFSNNPSAWGWNPLQYGGLPAQFMYLPLLHYATAALTWISRADPVYVYRLLTALLACLGPTSIYFFARRFTGRSWGVALAVAYTFFSPLYGLIPQVDKDRGVAQLPWRLHVLLKYGEGPHNAGLTMLPLAWSATWAVGTAGRYWRVFLCAVVFAAIVLTNWVAALALAFSSAMLLFAARWAPDAREFRVGRPLLAAVLGYLLACFWLTPTFIRTIAFNWPADAFNFQLQLRQWQLMGGLAAGLVAIRLFSAWLGWRFYDTFVGLCAFGFGYVVLVFYAAGIDTVPESRRYALEFETALTLSLFALLQFCWVRRNDVRLVCGAILAVGLAGAGAPQVYRYVTQGWAVWSPVSHESTAEYQLAKRLHGLRPQGRVLATGGLRFRLNAWYDLQQVGGSFESGLRNRTPVHFAYHVRTGADSTPESEVGESLLEMKALGVQYVVVHGVASAEHYRDYANPRKFEGVLERVATDSNAADVIYRVPFRGLAHLLRVEDQPSWAHRSALPAFVEAMEDPDRPALSSRWTSSRSLEISGPIRPEHVVSLLVSYDDGWTATQDGRPVSLELNSLGFMNVLAQPSSSSNIVLYYAGTIEQRFMFVISAASWILALHLLRRDLVTRARGAG